MPFVPANVPSSLPSFAIVEKSSGSYSTGSPGPLGYSDQHLVASDPFASSATTIDSPGPLGYSDQHLVASDPFASSATTIDCRHPSFQDSSCADNRFDAHGVHPGVAC